MSFLSLIPPIIVEDAEAAVSSLETLVVVGAETVAENIVSPNIFSVIFAAGGIFGTAVSVVGCVAGALPAEAVSPVALDTLTQSVASLLDLITQLSQLSIVFLQVNGPDFDTVIADFLNFLNLNFFRAAAPILCFILDLILATAEAVIGAAG